MISYKFTTHEHNKPSQAHIDFNQLAHDEILNLLTHDQPSITWRMRRAVSCPDMNPVHTAYNLYQAHYCEHVTKHKR
ncbi:hypothetical protein HanPSC8_Chr05g0188291 [Helianthus annuus]|nr:hypothetical protein HanPSC8_Chr05g0188291 [Helianthus annuus]